jgi:hypothetical protein
MQSDFYAPGHLNATGTGRGASFKQIVTQLDPVCATALRCDRAGDRVYTDFH